MYFCFHNFFRNLCGVECPTERPPENTGLCCVYCILHLPSLSESDIELLSESSLSESGAVDSEEWGWSGVGVFMDLMISACCFIILSCSVVFLMISSCSFWICLSTALGSKVSVEVVEEEGLSEGCSLNFLFACFFRVDVLWVGGWFPPSGACLLLFLFGGIFCNTENSYNQ